MNLSQNFTLEEMTRNNHGVTNKPSDASIESLKLLCSKVLEPLRKLYGKPITISSGYRSLLLNRLVGSKTQSSQHCKGEAVDIDSAKDNKLLFNLIKDNLEFDQLINENNYGWIHVSYRKTGNRNQILKL